MESDKEFFIDRLPPTLLRLTASRVDVLTTRRLEEVSGSQTRHVPATSRKDRRHAHAEKLATEFGDTKVDTDDVWHRFYIEATQEVPSPRDGASLVPSNRAFDAKIPTRVTGASPDLFFRVSFCAGFKFLFYFF